MSTQQELDLQARLDDMERQLAELAAKVNPLYSGGMDRYIHSGYLQWDGINLRLDKNAMQLQMAGAGAEAIALFFTPTLSTNPALQAPHGYIGGRYRLNDGANDDSMQVRIKAALQPSQIGNGSNAMMLLNGNENEAIAQLQADFQDDGAGVYFKLVDDASNPRIVWSLDGGSNEYELGGGGLKTSGGGYYLIPAGPAVGTGVSSSASANTYGSWTEMRAASGNALYIVGIEIQVADDNSVDYVQVDVGTGASASESSVGEAKIIARRHTISEQWGTYKIEFAYPIPVAASTRIACRTADDVASSLSHVLTLHVIDQADVVSI